VVSASYSNPERVLVEVGSIDAMIDVDLDIGMVGKSQF
jgi:hypothetical protein